MGNIGIDNPATGISSTDPILAENAEGFFQPMANSPLIAAADTGYPVVPLYPGMDYDNEISLDVMKEPRPLSITDRAIGASEFSSTINVQPHATELNTGPSYLFENLVDYIAANKLQLYIGGEGENSSIIVSSNIDWTVTSSTEWISTNISSGTGDAQLNIEEGGFSKAKLFLDEDGNFQLDENETSFNPDSNGSFAFPAPPGQYSVCILPDNPDANITFPIEDKKAYLTWIDYESPSNSLIFGVQDNSSEESNSAENNQSQTQESSSQNKDENNQVSESAKDVQPEEVNALYERLLQEMESKTKKLNDEQKIIGTVPNGRDY